MSSGKKVTLSTGYEIPQLGYGTWQAAPGEVGNGVYEALKAGYKHLDLAKIYENQKEVAQGIKKAFAEIPGLKREDIFITSKLWNTQHDPKHVEAALDDTLAELELDYLDLYLVHWPVSFGPGKDPHSDLFPLASANEVYIDSSVSNVETWKAVTKLPKSKVRSVGVSNFTVENLKTLIEKSGVVPAVNQIERHPILRSKELIAFAKEKNIHITAYSAFGNNFFDIPLLITRPEIKAIADKIGATPAQVILAWSQVGGHSVIPKSVTPTRIRENFQEIELSAEDVAAIEKMGEEHQGRRRYNVPYTANKPRWDINIFNEPEEQAATNGVVL